MPEIKPQVKTPPKGQGIKGKGPMGIPIWGWIAAIVIGLAIAYIFAKKSGAASQDTGSESGPNPLGGSDSGMGGGVVAPPSPNTIIQVLTDPGSTKPPPGGNGGGGGGDGGGGGNGGTTTAPAQTVFGANVDLLTPDSTFPNAGFATSPYVSETGYAVTGPGGPVIDLDQAISTFTAAIENPPSVENSSLVNTISRGAVIDYGAGESLGRGIPPPGGYPPIGPPEISGPPPPPATTTVLPHGQVVD